MPAKTQYSTVGFHLMNTSLWKNRVAPPNRTMTDRLIQWVASIGLRRIFSQANCPIPAAMATAVAPYMSENLNATKNRISGNRSNRSEEQTSELQSLMRISYAVFCLTQKKEKKTK